MSVERLLEGASVCVCAGAGGVGKTTTSAALALGAAARGRRAAVLTIDPARRLANALGVDELSNAPHRVDPGRLVEAGVAGDGELWAMMLDAKRTFDDLVERHAPDARTRDAVLANPIYRELSSAVAGSQEYMAMEKLYELHEEGRYDLLVLDTPPTRHALDFLDAPERLSRFVDSRSAQLLLSPGLSGLKLVSRGTAVALGVLRRLTGVDLMRDLADFFAAFGGLAEGFRERAVRVRALLGAPATTFLVVTSPQRHAVDEAIFFRRRLQETGMPFGGAIVNRVHDAGPAGGDVLADATRLLGDGLGRRVARSFEDHRRLAERDRAAVARLRAELEAEPLVLVPHFDDDVHDLGGLALVERRLFGGAPSGRARPRRPRR